MKPIYKNITSTGITTLMAKNSAGRVTINKITISNNSSSNSAVVSLQLWDGSSVGYNFIGNMTIPNGVVLVLDDNLSFDGSVYSLKMYSTGTSPALTVIIK